MLGAGGLRSHKVSRGLWACPVFSPCLVCWLLSTLKLFQSHNSSLRLLLWQTSAKLAPGGVHYFHSVFRSRFNKMHLNLKPFALAEGPCQKVTLACFQGSKKTEFSKKLFGILSVNAQEAANSKLLTVSRQNHSEDS